MGSQLYLPPTRFIPARAEQDLERYIRNELLNVAAHFTDLGRMKGWKLETSYTVCITLNSTEYIT